MVRDPYEVLGLPSTASTAEVRAAYHALVELYHPDRLQGARPAVQAEATRRLREAIDAVRAIEARIPAARRSAPLRAPGRLPAAAASNRAQPLDPFGPGIRIFDAELESVAPLPRLHVRWGGRHARAALALCHRLHEANRGLVRQLEWGSYQLELDGTDMNRVLRSLVPEDPGAHEPVSVVALATSLRDALYADGLPVATRSGADGPVVAMHRVLRLLEPEGRYSLIADSL